MDFSQLFLMDWSSSALRLAFSCLFACLLIFDQMPDIVCFPLVLCRTSFYSCERSGALFWGAVKLPGHDLMLSGLDFLVCEAGLGKCPSRG